MPQPTISPEDVMRVFLSHSTKDKEFVEQLAAAMSANGFEPWRCEVEIETGANFVECWYRCDQMRRSSPPDLPS